MFRIHFLYLCFIALCFFACKKDRDKIDVMTPEVHSSLSGKLSYKSHQWSYFRPENAEDAGQLSPRELAMFQPVEQRNEVEVEMRKDGTSKWTIINLPVTPLVQHNTMPDPRPPKYKTIIDQGQMLHYDEQGNLIRSYELDMQAFEEMLKMVFNQQTSSSVLANTSVGNSGHSETASERDDRFVTFSETDSSTGYTKEYTTDTEKGVVIQTKVYDEQNVLKTRTRMEYDICDAESPVLRKIRMSSGITSPESATALVNEIIIELENLNFEDYLN